ncbi:MAG: branched-chain amino acid ABC transporter permease [Anaerolineae bacterium]|nr:branched-chain amino acid ABC transporter permease [Anaerolineae bacterium]MDW8298390.1 branched-chain amino acid ABC transporter permease [Anaerolineae bacterium]
MSGLLSREKRGSLIAIGVILSILLLFSFFTTGDLSLVRTGGISAYLNTINPGDFSITLLSGLLRGMLLFLVAAGLSIVFGLMDVLNFAQGGFFMIGAYIAYELHHTPAIIAAVPDGNLRFLLGALVAIAIGAALGAALERGLLRPLYERPLFQLVITFGVSILILEATKLIWGVSPRSWTTVFGLNEGSFQLFGQQFSVYRLFVIIVGFALIIAVALLLQRTRIGIIIRAGVQDSQMVEALGINVRAVFTAVFTLGCAVAALGGAVAAPFLGASLGLSTEFLLGAVAAVVLGGLGSYEGTAIASLLVGITQAVVAKFGVQYLNQPVWESLSPMILLALVLLLRPSGLFGKE